MSSKKVHLSNLSLTFYISYKSKFRAILSRILTGRLTSAKQWNSAVSVSAFAAESHLFSPFFRT